MPVGTKATVKALTPLMIEETESKIILANTYHLVLKPGLEVLKKFGGAKKLYGLERSNAHRFRRISGIFSCQIEKNQ